MAELRHVGVDHNRSFPGSGRYRWGSGEQPYQRGADFLSTVAALRKTGMSDTEIAKAMGMTTTEFRARRTAANASKREAEIAQIRKLREKGMSDRAIAERMGIPVSTVRNRLKADSDVRKGQIDTAADLLKQNVEQSKYVEYGLGVEGYLGVSDTQLRTAVQMLKDEGYVTHEVFIKQPGSDNTTTLKVLCPQGTTKAELMEHLGDIRSPGVMIDEKGIRVGGVKRPVPIDSKRVSIRWDEDGGSDMDGVIEIRRGVRDLDMGGKQYAQVRILVDGTHYIKGMAIHADDLPDGVDIRVNSNKSKNGHTKLDALKKVDSGDPDTPFAASIKAQRTYLDKDGKRRQSALNIMREEGDWEWSNSLSAQFLSKQRVSVAKEQLSKLRKRREAEYDEIMALTNPLVRKNRLMELARKCDSDAVDLQAAAFPRQTTQVLLPCTKLKPGEVYAPNYKNGEKVALVRYPHAGPFEIPELTVNNRNKGAQRLLGKNLKDAVGIHPSVAAKLSGADFDGDFVVVIPNNNGQVKTAPSLKGLAGFDPKKAYPGTATSKRMPKSAVQRQMGMVSNLITDMTVQGASQSEIARAVRHSMVVIDANKHGLDYKQSELDNGIADLKRKYQPTGGASTLISRAKSPTYVPKKSPRSYKDGGPIDKRTGREVFVLREGYTTKSGETRYYKTKSAKMKETTDARTLISKKGSSVENVYAFHANSLKAQANKYRKAAVSQPRQKYNPDAAKEYAPEVQSLRAKLKVAVSNKPRERQAQVLANAKTKAYAAANPGADDKAIEKYSYKALTNARLATGAKRNPVTFTAKEWKAVNKGAISENLLSDLMANATSEHIAEISAPRQSRTLSGTTLSRAKVLQSRGYTTAEIAEALGVSSQAVRNSI